MKKVESSRLAPGVVLLKDITGFRVWHTGGSWDSNLWRRGVEGMDQQHFFRKLSEARAASATMNNVIVRIRPFLWKIVANDDPNI